MNISEKKIIHILTFIAIIVNCQLSTVNSQEVIPFAYGDMEKWVVREIKESAVIGGNIKYLYELGPIDTIIGNDPYTNRGGSPWANSNALAKTSGVTKASASVFPEKRGNGMCAKLETFMETVKVLGLIDVEVIVSGSVFLGKMHEPIKGTKNPQSKFESGIPFTKRPKTLQFDYKVKMAPETSRIKSSGSGKSTVEGRDEAVVVLLLQKRWEDKDGRIFAKRIGTMIQRYPATVNNWVNNAQYPILYGNISSRSDYKEYMKIQDIERYALNSKGQSTPILETEWGNEDDTPTHMVLEFASSHGGAYVGSPGNTFWIDNIALVY